MSQSSSALTSQVREVREGSTDALPPILATQPTSSKLVVNVLHLIEAGSPNLTTISAGVIVSGQPSTEKQVYISQSLQLVKKNNNISLYFWKMPISNTINKYDPTLQQQQQ